MDRPGENKPEDDQSLTGVWKKIKEQSELVRKLKSDSEEESKIDAEVKILLQLKQQYKNETGQEWPSTMHNTRNSSEEKRSDLEKETQAVKPSQEKKLEESPALSNVKKQTYLGMETKKEENVTDWYSQVIMKGELIETHNVSGFYIMRPWSFSIWDVIRDRLDKEIKKLGVQKCYFPMFISRTTLQKGKIHNTNFVPEVAWVTMTGSAKLAEPIAIRSTSESAMYPTYAKWLRSHRDLPIKLYQWNNIVRWESKCTQPLIRAREMLWQEGHTAFATSKEAQEEVYKVLDVYANIYTDLLAIPVIKGRKTEKEKCTGSVFTTTVEIFIPASGLTVQGAASSFLGQNFSKMFEIAYSDPETQEKRYVYQNSWGITTCTIGVMVMVHGDNQGLVLPPRVAAHQVVIVPCGVTTSLSEKERETLINSCKAVEDSLTSAGVRVYGDYRDNRSPGWKFNHWELKGVPVRLEIGPRDIANKKVMLTRRDTGKKITVELKDIVNSVHVLLQNIHGSLLKKATDDLKTHTVVTNKWSEFITSLNKKCVLLSPFCGSTTCEDKIKQDSVKSTNKKILSMGVKSLCIPFEQPRKLSPSDKCVHPECKKKPSAYTLFGRNY